MVSAPLKVKFSVPGQVYSVHNFWCIDINQIQTHKRRAADHVISWHKTIAKPIWPVRSIICFFFCFFSNSLILRVFKESSICFFSEKNRSKKQISKNGIINIARKHSESAHFHQGMLLKIQDFDLHSRSNFSCRIDVDTNKR